MIQCIFRSTRGRAAFGGELRSVTDGHTDRLCLVPKTMYTKFGPNRLTAAKVEKRDKITDRHTHTDFYYIKNMSPFG